MPGESLAANPHFVPHGLHRSRAMRSHRLNNITEVSCWKRVANELSIDGCDGRRTVAQEATN